MNHLRGHQLAASSVFAGVSGGPPPCGRMLDGWINGFAHSHSPSETIRLHVSLPPAFQAGVRPKQRSRENNDAC